jgi:hypothetical protein
VEAWFEAYVCGSELLVSAEDGTAALSGIESTLALDGGLAVGARSTDGLADLGDLVPVAHCEGVVWVCWWWVSRVLAVRLFGVEWYCSGGCDMCVIARVRSGKGNVKNMMCSGLWGGGGVVSEAAVTKPITES